MDPNATLRRIDEFLGDHCTGDEVDELCEDLYAWICRGGFEPEWSRYELGTGYYRCRVVTMDKQGVR